MSEPNLELPIEAAREKPYNLLPLTGLFLLTAVVFIFLGGMAQEWNFNAGILITEFLILVVPAALYMKLRKHSIRQQFRFKKLPLKSALLIVFAGLCFIPIVGLSNAVVNLWLFYGLNIMPPEVPTETGAFGPVISFVIVALTPGFCEEFFFRGMVMTEMEKRMSQFAAGMVTAVLFGLFHFNFMNCFGPMLLGVIFAYTNQITESIWAGMLGHALNNSVAVVMLYVTANSDRATMAKEMSQYGSAWPWMVLGTLIVFSIFALPIAYVGTLLLKKLRLRHLKVGDQLIIQSKKFTVIGVTGPSLTLHPEFKEPLADGSLLSETVETSYARIKMNKELRVTNPHWEKDWGNFKFKVKEWWPIGLFIMMYFVVMVLSFKHYLKAALAQ